jgi:GrpB-like predicted nucleotidyltransferase (UPF0157 family)
MKISKKLQEKINRVVKEDVDIVPYDLAWVIKFGEESVFLKDKFPKIIKRIEHFGSTSVPGLSAKPVVDMLIEITNYDDVKREIVPVLESLGYDYFWRPEIDKPPYYTWFIKRDLKGIRTHHLHMVKANSRLWDRLYFRDYLITHPDISKEYESLKIKLSKENHNNREAYTKAKTDFVVSITKIAKKALGNQK